MDMQYLADETTIKKSKSIRILSIVALSLSGAYLLLGIFSTVLAVIPLPFLGLLIWFVLSAIEFVLLVAAVTVGIIALVQSIKHFKAVNACSESAEKDEAFGYIKLARTLSIISVIATGCSWILISILNVLEFFLSLI